MPIRVRSHKDTFLQSPGLVISRLRGDSNLALQQWI